MVGCFDVVVTHVPISDHQRRSHGDEYLVAALAYSFERLSNRTRHLGWQNFVWKNCGSVDSCCRVELQKPDVRISADLCSQTDKNLQAQVESYPPHGVIGERLHEGWNQLWGSAVGLPGRYVDRYRLPTAGFRTETFRKRRASIMEGPTQKTGQQL